MFAVDDTTRVRRFLILGCDGGTYYSTEREMKVDNAQAIVDIIKKGFFFTDVLLIIFCF